MKAEDAVSAGISRRRFLKGAGRVFWGGVLMSSGLAFPAVGSNAIESAYGGRPMDYLKHSTFSRLIGETFKIRLGPSETITVRLIEAVERGGDKKEKDGLRRQECFSILFQGPVDKSLAQGTYHFHHHRTNDFALFIVPVGIDDKGRHYEAVVNRMRA